VRTTLQCIIVEATALVTADATPTDLLTHDPGGATDGDDRDDRSLAEFRRLMDLADHDARRLMASADPPPGVLLLVEPGGLDVITLEGPDPDVRALPRRVALHHPSSAAVVVAQWGMPGGVDGGVVHVVGETVDGLRDERRFRVRACGHSRRLTRLRDHDAGDALRLVPRLFPPPAPVS
jgi:hypothetical protein